MEFSKALDKLGDTALTRDDEEDDIGAAFQKFAVVTKELSALMKNMVSFFMIWMWISIYLFLCEVNAACSWPSIVHHNSVSGCIEGNFIFSLAFLLEHNSNFKDERIKIDFRNQASNPFWKFV